MIAMKPLIPEFYLPLFDEISTLIHQSSSILICSHISPDGDNIGSQMAFADYLLALGKKAFIINNDELPEDFSFLPDSERFRSYQSFNGEFPSFDLVIILDSGEFSRIGEVANLYTDQPVIDIDHHDSNNRFGIVNLIDPNASSVGEILFQYFSYVNFDIPQSVAWDLYVSIVTDTGHFKYEKTRPVVHQIAAELLQKGVDPAETNRLLNQTKPASYVHLMGLALSRLTLSKEGRIAYAWIDYEELSELGMPSSDGIINILGIIDSVSVYFIVKEKEKGLLNVSLRSKFDVDVAKVAKAFGGGGHSKAAGCRSSELNRQTFIDQLNIEISKQL